MMTFGYRIAEPPLPSRYSGERRQHIISAGDGRQCDDTPMRTTSERLCCYFSRISLSFSPSCCRFDTTSDVSVSVDDMFIGAILKHIVPSIACRCRANARSRVENTSHRACRAVLLSCSCARPTQRSARHLRRVFMQLAPRSGFRAAFRDCTTLTTAQQIVTPRQSY